MDWACYYQTSYVRKIEMLYVKIHDYIDQAGQKRQTIVSTVEQTEGFEIVDTDELTHLTIVDGKIVFKDSAKIIKEIKAKNLEQILIMRSREYPPMADYLDAVVKNDQVAIQKYIDNCLAVKAKYPKPKDE